MRHSLICLWILLIGIGLVSAQESPKPKWRVFSSHVGKVTMKFPARPEVERRASEMGEGYTVTAYLGERIYILNFLKHEFTLGETAEKAAATSIKGFQEASGAKVSNEKDFKYKKHIGKAATFEIERQGVTLDYWVLVIGRTQYQFMAVAPIGDPDPKTAKKFLKSFKYMKK